MMPNLDDDTKIRFSDRVFKKIRRELEKKNIAEVSNKNKIFNVLVSASFSAKQQIFSIQYLTF